MNGISMADLGAEASLGAWMIAFALIALAAAVFMLPVWIGSQVQRALESLITAMR